MPTSNTPLPAAELLALCDDTLLRWDLLRKTIRVEYGHLIIDTQAFAQLRESVDAYRAARLASPVTLEEALMAESCRAWNNYTFARDIPGNGDVVKLLAKHNDAHRANAEHAATLSVAAYEREEHARALAKKGPGHE